MAMDKRLRQQSKLAHDLALELTKPKASHNSHHQEGHITAEAVAAYSSTAVARQLSKPALLPPAGSKDQSTDHTGKIIHLCSAVQNKSPVPDIYTRYKI